MCKFAEDERIHCIVMGRRGMNSFERIIYGSVSTYVMNNAKCAVCMIEKGMEDNRFKEVQDTNKKKKEIESPVYKDSQIF